MKQPANMRRNKALYIDWTALHDDYDDVPVLRALTARQYTALVAISEYFAWATRWQNPPDKENLDKFAGEIRWRLMQDVEICALVIACITDDDDVRAALEQWFVDTLPNSPAMQQVINQSYTQNLPGQVLPPSVTGANLIPGTEGCSNNQIWGAVSNFVDWMNLNNVDFLEKFEVLTNPIENLSNLLDSVGGVDVTVFGSALTEWINFIQDSLKENYDASYTTAYRNSVACDLYCISLVDCDLSLDDALTYFMGRIGSISLPETLLDGVVYWVTGVWTGTQFCDVMMAMQLAAFKFGNTFIGLLGMPSVQGALRLGYDQPTDDWVTLCEVCPEESSHRFNFEIDEQGWQPFGTYATYVDASGWFEDTTGIIWIYIPIPDGGRRVTSVRFEVATGNQLLAQVGTPADCSVGFKSVSPGAGYNIADVDLTDTPEFDGPITEIACRVAVDGFVPTTGAITALTLYMDGSDPF